MGFAENVGDALTVKILTEEKRPSYIVQWFDQHLTLTTGTNRFHLMSHLKKH